MIYPNKDMPIVAYFDQCLAKYAAEKGMNEAIKIQQGFVSWGRNFEFNGDLGIQVINQFLRGAERLDASPHDIIYHCFVDSSKIRLRPRDSKEVLERFINCDKAQI